MPASALPALSDLETDRDIAAVVDAFYGDIDADPLLGRYFAGLDWAAHLPKMVAFWSSVVFGSGAYRGRPFDAHLQLEGLTAEHFGQWVQRFHATVDARFRGPNADRMKARAEQIAGIFRVKLGLWSVLEAPAS